METMLGHTRVPSVISHKWSVVAGVWGSTASRVSVLSSKCFSKSVEASVEGLNCELTSVLLKLVALFECSVWKFWNPESEFRFEVSESNPLLNTGSLQFKLSSSSQLKAMLPWNTLFCWLRIWLAVPKTRLFRTDSGWVSPDLGTPSPSKITLFRRLLTPLCGGMCWKLYPRSPPSPMSICGIEVWKCGCLWYAMGSSGISLYGGGLESEFSGGPPKISPGSGGGGGLAFDW